MNREKLFRDMIYHGTLKEEYCYYYFYEKIYHFYNFQFFSLLDQKTVHRHVDQKTVHRHVSTTKIF